MHKEQLLPIPDLPSVPFTFRYKHMRGYAILCSGICKAWQTAQKQIVVILEYRHSPPSAMYLERAQEANHLALATPELHLPLMHLEAMTYSESLLRAFITLRTNEIDYLSDFPTAKAGIVKLPVAKPFRSEAQMLANRLALFQAEISFQSHSTPTETDADNHA